MKAISRGGTVSITETILLTNSQFKENFIQLRLVKFTNIAAFTIILFKYIDRTKTSIPIYTLNLEAGDTIFDSTNYTLGIGESLRASCDITNTTFLVEATIE